MFPVSRRNGKVRDCGAQDHGNGTRRDGGLLVSIFPVRPGPRSAATNRRGRGTPGGVRSEAGRERGGIAAAAPAKVGAGAGDHAGSGGKEIAWLRKRHQTDTGRVIARYFPCFGMTLGCARWTIRPRSLRFIASPPGRPIELGSFVSPWRPQQKTLGIRVRVALRKGSGSASIGLFPR